jgi:hypothetical protein
MNRNSARISQSGRQAELVRLITSPFIGGIVLKFQLEKERVFREVTRCCMSVQSLL